MRFLICVYAMILVAPVTIACGPSENYQTENQKKGIYKVVGEFSEPIGIIIIDRNGVFDISWAAGSAFLIDANKGIFGTAKHVVDLDTKYKIFFCGRVYKAERILPPVISDVAFIQITGKFDSSSFPKPYPIATNVSLNDEVFVRGIHPHPPDMQNGVVVHSIIKSYYGLDNYRSEFVYDNLSARVTDLTELISSDTFAEREHIGASIIFRYIKVSTHEEHKITGDSQGGFRGLSGGPTINVQKQIVGINGAQPDEEYYALEENGLRYKPRVTLSLVPVAELRRALRSLP